MLTQKSFRRFAIRASALCLFSLPISAVSLAQQITCPVANPVTITSTTATNSVNPCQIEPLAILTIAKTGKLENKPGGVLVNEITLTNDGTLLNDADAVLTNDASLFNTTGATLTNSGTLNGTGTVQNGGTIDFEVFSTGVQSTLFDSRELDISGYLVSQ